MKVTKRPLTGWEIYPTIADRNHLEATLKALEPLCEVAVECQAEAVSAKDSLTKIIATLPPIKTKPRAQKAGGTTTPPLLPVSNADAMDDPTK